VFHADGTLAEPPIALCEVQAYAYAARKAAATLARVAGQHERAEELLRDAETLRRRFDEAFWCDELDMYALALDADKKQCKVRTSNAGHALFAGIAYPERAKRLAESITDERFFSGWGLRTVAADEARYNPMSYHNGSVWPHDNAIIAAGLSRYGYKQLALKVVEGLYDSTAWFDVNRLPELFCGFPRRPNGGPTLYPVACSPQAWAAGAVLMLVEAMLGLQVRGSGEVVLIDPVLPHYLRGITIEGLHVGSSVVDIEMLHRDGALSLHVPRRLGDVEVRVQSSSRLPW
jgi:glycogen debranching enzyme